MKSISFGVCVVFTTSTSKTLTTLDVKPVSTHNHSLYLKLRLNMEVNLGELDVIF